MLERLGTCREHSPVVGLSTRPSFVLPDRGASRFATLYVSTSSPDGHSGVYTFVHMSQRVSEHTHTLGVWLHLTPGGQTHPYFVGGCVCTPLGLVSRLSHGKFYELRSPRRVA